MQQIDNGGESEYCCARPSDLTTQAIPTSSIQTSDITKNLKEAQLTKQPSLF